jgi:hypothetical protein
MFLKDVNALLIKSGYYQIYEKLYIKRENAGLLLQHELL